MSYRISRGPRRAENRIPLLIFVIVMIISFAIRSGITETPTDRLEAIQQWPLVEVSTTDLIDECGVFMWARWIGPGFGPEDPYIPMGDRYR